MLQPPRHNPAWFTRKLARIVWPGRGRVHTTQDLRQLERVLRFTAVFLGTIFAPALLLAYLGVSSGRSGETEITEELQFEATASIESALSRVEAVFEYFESSTRSRVQRGLSPSESVLELSPYLLAGLRLDDEGRVAAPFQHPTTQAPVDHAFYFSGAFAAARRLELAGGDPHEALRSYDRALAEARGQMQQGVVQLQRARLLERIGRLRDAHRLYADIVADYSPFRDIWGFPIGQLANLKRGEMLLEREPEIGVGALVSLVEEILALRWEIGQGGEAAVARRALVLMEGKADADTVASLRNRLDERTNQLYWAERLLPELEQVTGGGSLLKVAPGRFSYTFGDRALWAVVWMHEDLYAFALDWAAIETAVERFATWAARSDGQVRVSVQQPEETPPEDVFARRTLAPWLVGWSLVAHSADPDALRQAYSNRRTRRFLVIGSAVLLLLVGAFLSIVLVRREMDLARMKTTFAASVSHELRSPITQIRLKGESLMLGLAEDDNDRQRHYEAIVREAERLSRLVDNVLDFAAIERGTKLYQLRPADLGRTLENSVESMRFSMESRGLDLEVDIPVDLPVIRHDSDAVSQVMTNLLSNAAKYGGGFARVSAVQLPDGVQVEVSDRGIGINPDEAERIFDQFYRSDDPRARRSKGTGIGLAIVKYIMEAHGGTVTVKTMPGQGSIFQLFFPFTPENPGVR